MSTRKLLLAVLSGTVFLLIACPCRGALPCSSDDDCTSLLREGSLCVDGSCSNPFVQGCLKTLKPDHTTGRVCNSDDKKAGSTDCVYLDEKYGYPEIRIHNGNWESSIFFAWILQILLMEILNVPATVGLTTDTTAISGFYSPRSELAYSAKAYPFDALRDAGACHETDEECAHVLPEVWNGQLHEWTKALNEEYIEPVEGNGQVGKGSWYVPAFTANRDDSLVSFYGLRGERNRHKLADAFRRPTSWSEYCLQVSKDNCTTADDTAKTYPPDEGMAARYFAPPDFMGHFALTEANNCTINPDTCIGHIVGPGCTWSTNIDAQLYWNDIKLLPDGPIEPNGGYGYSALIEIWRAANQTKSNMLLWWWKPEALVEQFHGTDFQFQMVLLPEATDVCSRARVGTEQRCSLDIMDRRGSPEGACDQEAHALQKIFSKAFAENSRVASEATRSPGFDLMKAVKITDLEINNMLRRWIGPNVDRYGNDAREAVCGWVVDNLDSLMDFIPPGYPKELSENSSYDTAFLHTATALGIFSALAVTGTAFFAIRYRRTKVFIYAQLHIVLLILFGFLMITVGAILTTLEPSNALCVATSWLVNLGYTVELVPLLVKIAAINKILTSAKKMKRVKISRKGMLFKVGCVVFFIIAILALWTILDPPAKVEQRVLPYQGSTTIETSLTCASEKDFWVVAALGWQGLLLLMATVLAFQSRDIVQEFNESRSLGTMIYSHLMFLVLRGIMYNLAQQEVFRPNTAAAVTSVLLSLDTLFAIGIYFVPKNIEAKVSPNGYSSSRNSIAGRSSIAVSDIEAKASLANSSYKGRPKSRGNESLSRDSNRSGFTSDTSVPRTTFSGGKRSNFAGIPEAPCESDSDDQFRPDMGPRGGSSRLDASGAVIRTPPRKPTSLRNFTRRLSAELGLQKVLGADSFSLANNNDLGQRNESLRKMPSIKASSLRITHSQEELSDRDSDDDDEYDAGGPRFSNTKANKELQRSVRMLSSADPDFFAEHSDDSMEEPDSALPSGSDEPEDIQASTTPR